MTFDGTGLARSAQPVDLTDGTDGVAAQHEVQHERSIQRHPVSPNDTPVTSRTAESAGHITPYRTAGNKRNPAISNGEGGIRTRGAKKSHTGFRNQLLQPLGHLSSSF